MGLFNKVQRTPNKDMLCVYIRHFRDIHHTYIEHDGDVKGFLHWRGVQQYAGFICEPIPELEQNRVTIHLLP